MDDDSDFNYYIQLLMHQSTDPNDLLISQLFEPRPSNTNTNNNTHHLNNNTLSLNPQSLTSVRAYNVPCNNNNNNNPPTLIPTPTLPPPTYAPMHNINNVNNMNMNNLNNMNPQQYVAMPPPPIDLRAYLSPNYVPNPLDPNWEAIGAFLSGQVRTGSDVERVFKCTVCNVEFANAQALGGHMSSHTKNKKSKEASLGSNRNKCKSFKRAGKK